MTIDDLLRERRIYRQDVASMQIQGLLQRAGDDLASAKHMLQQDPDWSLSISYNAVLRASRALMFSRGFRPASHEGHKNTFAFLRAIVEDDRAQLISYFDRIRVKRHQAVYEVEARASMTEAESLIEQARGFVAWVRSETAE